MDMSERFEDECWLEWDWVHGSREEWQLAWCMTGELLLACAFDTGYLAPEIYENPSPATGPLPQVGSFDTAELAERIDELVGPFGRLVLTTAAAALLVRRDMDRSAGPELRPGCLEDWRFDFATVFDENEAAARRTIRRFAMGEWSAELWHAAMTSVANPWDHTVRTAAHVLSDTVLNAAASIAGFCDVDLDMTWLADPAADPVAVVGIPRILESYLDSATKARTSAHDGVPICAWIAMWGHRTEAVRAALTVCRDLAGTVSAAGYGELLATAAEPPGVRLSKLRRLTPWFDSSITDSELAAGIAAALRPVPVDPGEDLKLLLSDGMTTAGSTGAVEDLDPAPLWSLAALLAHLAGKITGQDPADLARTATRAAFASRTPPRFEPRGLAR